MSKNDSRPVGKHTHRLKIGIVGMGNAGMMHVGALTGGELPRAELVAVCDTEEKLSSLSGHIPDSAKRFYCYEDMISSGVCEAVIVATPHPQHPELSIKAFEKGLHVFCEKPSGVSVGSARKMNEAAVASGKIFAMHFNKRLEPLYQKLHILINSGELGQIHRINWIATNWYRPDCYFASASWRGTWAGEGGGLLINQCIHDLDIWQYLFGMPKRIRSFCKFGKHHNIEVEDEVTAFFEYEKGVTGSYIASTGESPGTNRIEIACSLGKLVVEDKTIKFYRTEVALDEFNKTNKKGFGEPDCWVCDVPVSGKADLSKGMLGNFIDAVLDQTPLLVDGSQGVHSLELENAILLSCWLDGWATLPVNEKAFDEELNKHIASSKPKKDVATGETFDLKESFK